MDVGAIDFKGKKGKGKGSHGKSAHGKGVTSKGGKGSQDGSNKGKQGDTGKTSTYFNGECGF